MSIYGDTRFSHRDKMHEEVVSWYEELYCSVVDLHTLGHGIPDLLVGCVGLCELAEVKSEDGHLESNQITFQNNWRGANVVVVKTHSDVINHVANMRERVSRRRS